MLGIMDAGNYQSLIDMKTGRQIEGPGNDFAEIKALARDWPYPGDLSDQSIDWVTGAAQVIADMHHPDWMFLSYVQPYFIELFSPEDKALSQQRQRRILEGIRSFAARNGFEPLIVATSEYVPLKGFITQPETKGVLESWPWGFAMAGISGAAAEDEEILNSHPLIQHVIPKSRVLASYPDLRPNFVDYFPDYVVTAQEGYAFRGLNYHHGQLFMADTYAPTLPVFSAIGRPRHIRDIRGLMDQALDAGKKVLLVVIEGCRQGSLPAEFGECDNMDDWYSYRGIQLYHILHTGMPFYQTDNPPVFSRSWKPRNTEYPLSGFTNAHRDESIGARLGIRTAAVSSRGIVAQTVTNADLMLESYCRDLANMGVLAAFKPDKL